MTKYLFDVNCMLEHGKNIDQLFAGWFMSWAKNKHYYLITRATHKKLLVQLGDEIVNNAQLVFVRSGKDAYIQGHHIMHYDLAKDKSDIATLLEHPIIFFAKETRRGESDYSLSKEIVKNCGTCVTVSGWKNVIEELENEQRHV